MGLGGRGGAVVAEEEPLRTIDKVTCTSIRAAVLQAQVYLGSDDKLQVPY